MENIQIGQKMTFIPTGFITDTGGAMFRFGNVPTRVTGTVVGINRKHHWYRAQFEVNGVTLHECFKFTD